MPMRPGCHARQGSASASRRTKSGPTRQPAGSMTMLCRKRWTSAIPVSAHLPFTTETRSARRSSTHYRALSAALGRTKTGSSMWAAMYGNGPTRVTRAPRSIRAVKKWPRRRPIAASASSRAVTDHTSQTSFAMRGRAAARPGRHRAIWVSALCAITVRSACCQDGCGVSCRSLPWRHQRT